MTAMRTSKYSPVSAPLLGALSNLALSILLFPLLSAEPATAQTLGMVADGTSSVTIFNADTDTVLATVPISSGSIGDCSITADQTLGFVTNFRSEVFVIDLQTLALASGTNPIPISNPGEDTSLSPDAECPRVGRPPPVFLQPGP